MLLTVNLKKSVDQELVQGQNKKSEMDQDALEFVETC